MSGSHGFEHTVRTSYLAIALEHRLKFCLVHFRREITDPNADTSSEVLHNFCSFLIALRLLVKKLGCFTYFTTVEDIHGRQISFPAVY